MEIQKKMERFVIIPELLSLKTNVIDLIPQFLLGAFMHKTWSEKTRINLSFRIVNDFEKPQGFNKRFGSFWGTENSPQVYYEKKFSEGIKFKMLVKKTNNDFNFIVNKLYFKYSPFRIDRMLPPGQHLQNAAILSLANLGFTVLHGACLSKNNQGILLIASSNMGKSLTAFSALKKGYKFLSEDMLALNERFAYAAPLISCRTCYEKFSGKKGKKRAFGKNKLPFWESVNFFLSLPRIFFPQGVSSGQPFENFLSGGKVIEKTKVSKIVILERGDEGLVKLREDECLEKVLILNRGEYAYYHDSFLRALSYCNPEVDIKRIVQTEEKVLSHLVKKSSCYLLQVENPFQYVEYLDKL